MATCGGSVDMTETALDPTERLERLAASWSGSDQNDRPVTPLFRQLSVRKYPIHLRCRAAGAGSVSPFAVSESYGQHVRHLCRTQVEHWWSSRAWVT